MCYLLFYLKNLNVQIQYVNYCRNRVTWAVLTLLEKKKEISTIIITFYAQQKIGKKYERKKTN
jgi:hypothetical protein